MKAVIARGTEPVFVDDRCPPQLRDDYIRVKTVAVAINPTDWKHIAWSRTQDGCLVGSDFAGVVEAIGPKVTKLWQKGDRVAGTVHGTNYVQIEDGAFAEYIVATGDVCLRIPPDMSFEDAAAVPLGIASVMQGLYQQGLKLRPVNDPHNGHEFVLIYGASTATSAMGIQWAKLSGYSVVAVTSKKHYSYVESLGVSAVFDYEDENVGEKINTFTEDKLKLVWDTISTNETAKICAEAMSSDGAGCRYASWLDNKSPRTDVVSIGTNMYTIWGERFMSGEVEWPAVPADFQEAVAFAPLAEKLLESGAVKPHRVNVRPHGLAGVVEGLQDMLHGRVDGEKWVYRVSDTPSPRWRISES